MQNIYKGKNTNSSFSLDKFIDKGDISGYATNALKFCVEKGIITGNDKLGKDKLRILPKNNATRAESAKMFTVFCQNVLGM